MNILQMKFTQTKEQQQQMAQKVQKAIQKLGTKYLCHPTNFVQRKSA